MADRGHPKEVVCAKHKKVIQQILRNIAKVVKIVIFSPTGGPHQGPGNPLRVIHCGLALYG